MDYNVNDQSKGTLIIKEAFCQITFHPHWPLSIEREPEYGSVSQNLPGIPNSAIFLHYGLDRTVANYVGGWQERYGNLATLEEDKEVVQHGLNGRYMRLNLEEMVTRKGMIPVECGRGIAPEPEITPAQILVCVGYAIRQLPVLVGYLIPREIRRSYFVEAERIINSLRPLD